MDGFLIEEVHHLTVAKMGVAPSMLLAASNRRGSMTRTGVFMAIRHQLSLSQSRHFLSLRLTASVFIDPGSAERNSGGTQHTLAAVASLADVAHGSSDGCGSPEKPRSRPRPNRRASLLAPPDAAHLSSDGRSTAAGRVQQSAVPHYHPASIVLAQERPSESGGGMRDVSRCPAAA